MQLPDDVSTCHVTISTPRADGEGSVEASRINLFLYQVAENPHLKNMEIPDHGHPGSYGKPPLSLDLHYLLTAYGSTSANDDGLVDETRAHQLLGSAMSVFHDHPIIDKTSPSLEEVLRHEFEEIKIYLDPVDLEELSKVWTALTLSYRLSAAYKVSVVQIESRHPRPMGLPVQTRRIHMDIRPRPVLSAVYRTPTPDNDIIGVTRVLPGESITLEGHHFGHPVTWVHIGGLDPIAVRPDSETRLQTTVPESEDLHAGILPVEVAVEKQVERVQGALDSGTSDLDTRTVHSNRIPIMVLPQITGLEPAEADRPNILLTIIGRRLWHPGAQTQVLVGEFSILVRPPHTGDGWATPDHERVQVPLGILARELAGLEAGDYEIPVRVMVDGVTSAESVPFTYHVSI